MNEQVITQETSRARWTPSTKVVARKIKGKLIIVPIEDGIADLNDVMFSFNDTGSMIWECIEKKHTQEEICATLAKEYEADLVTIERGVVNLVRVLLEKGIVEEWKS